MNVLNKDFKKFKLVFSCFLVVFLSLHELPVFGNKTPGNLTEIQEDAKVINQKIFNLIEYQISLKGTDSIYNLTSPLFKQNIDRNAFKVVFNTQIYPMGSIRNARMVEFSSSTKIARYRVDFTDLTLLFEMMVNENNQIDYFMIKPFTLKKEEDLPIIQSVPKDERAEAFINEVGKRQSQKQGNYQLAISVIQNGQSKDYFFGNKTKPTHNSVFEIGSLTKTFTATLLAYYANQGLFSLDDSIHSYLPDSLQNISALQGITFKSLANHTSGLPRLPENLDKEADFNPQNPYAHYTNSMLGDYLKTLDKKESPEYPPFAYSNLGYGVLGVLLENITQKTYEEMILEVISTPLNLKNTQVSTASSTVEIATPQNENGRALIPWTFQAMEAAGGLRSNIEDLSQYVKSHLKTPDSDLDEALLITRQFTYFYPPETDLGLAWFIQLKNDQIMYFHDGQTAGSSSFIAMNPDTKSAVIILSNSNEGVVNIGNQIWEYIFGN